MEKDGEGNAKKGNVLFQSAKNNLVSAGERLVTVVGMENTIVVETKDAILVADMSQSQEIKNLVDSLKKQQSSEYKEHQEVCRPWGKYERIGLGDRYQVKKITVNPKAKLSIQFHHHRSEHWIVVKGTAKVFRGKDIFTLTESESTYIPLGEVHSLENPGEIPLELIEVQSGAYLGEDDIVRLEDRYGRIPSKKAEEPVSVS